MTQYQVIEISNQQVHGDYPHLELTPRIECVIGDRVYTSVNDFQARLGVTYTDFILFDAHGRLLAAAHQSLPSGDVHYHIVYRLTETTVEITASIDSAPAPARFILPAISQRNEEINYIDSKTVRIKKTNGQLSIHTDAPQGFEASTTERTFNLVPGFECLPLAIAMQPGKEIKIELGLQS